ncbi:DBH-like monooxygenase 1, partial [Brachionus plicatilis]
DRYVYGQRSINDINTDIELLNGFESKGFTVFKIKRPLVLCDPDDRSIETGTPYVIFPWHIHDPENSYEIDLDTKNQSTQLNFFRKNLEISSDHDESQVFEIKLHKKIIPIKHHQYCQAFQIPKNLSKKHIYQWSTELPESDPHLISSIKLYECSHDYSYAGEVDCDFSLNTAFCSRSSIGWNLGSEMKVSFPADIGYPIGTDTDYGFLVLNLEFIDLEQSSSKILIDLNK